MLENLSAYYRGLEHQKNAVSWLENLLTKYGYGTVKLLELDTKKALALESKLSIATMSAFTDLWRNDTGDAYDPTYFSQIDNGLKPYVTCNSSSHAMVIESVKPGTFKGKNGDEVYVKSVLQGKYGKGGHRNPSIFHEVHTQGLKAYGIKSEWSTSKTSEQLKELVKSQKLTAVNILHKGGLSNLGGGHIVCLKYLDDKKVQVLDPYGVLNFKEGVYTGIGSKAIYNVDWSLLLKRWQGGCRVVSM